MFTGPFVAIHCLFLLTAGGCASGIYIDIANYKCFSSINPAPHWLNAMWQGFERNSYKWAFTIYCQFIWYSYLISKHTGHFIKYTYYLGAAIYCNTKFFNYSLPHLSVERDHHMKAARTITFNGGRGPFSAQQ